jgi:hypothetical protein
MAEVTETAVLCDTIILKYRLLIEFYSYETSMTKESLISQKDMIILSW